MLNVHKAPSPHFNERALPLDSIILHYTDMPTTDEALAWLCHPTSQVSTHYLIDEKGKIYQLVEDEKRAWHAGESFWQDCTDMNSCSLGIELSNPGHSHGYQPFPEAQINALLQLCEQLRTRWDIPKNRILGHSDIAPRRKQDPGHLFPWKKLAREGLGLWPSTHRPVIENDDNSVENSLAIIGYETLSLPHTIRAFKRHFQPHQGDDQVDEETHLLIQGLLDSIKMLI
ncbi:MAG: N-acetylmuramoyl-L-alanine amidase [Alphaproteobacteria bacterium]|nr:N-acetylmuramoyl-L-alanine amidase [Alphaproteobacteria bacterium]